MGDSAPCPRKRGAREAGRLSTCVVRTRERSLNAKKTPSNFKKSTDQGCAKSESKMDGKSQEENL